MLVWYMINTCSPEILDPRASTDGLISALESLHGTKRNTINLAKRAETDRPKKQHHDKSAEKPKKSTTPGVEPGISRDDAEPKSSALAIRPRGRLFIDWIDLFTAHKRKCIRMHRWWLQTPEIFYKAGDTVAPSFSQMQELALRRLLILAIVPITPSDRSPSYQIHSCFAWQHAPGSSLWCASFDIENREHGCSQSVKYLFRLIRTSLLYT
ncbi:hypothetical protein HDV63DRAFT_87027 [Trichoderma sp. SZMC 28014]